MEKPATLAQEARSGVIGSAGPENSTGPYNGAGRVLRWRNDGTHTSPHWVAHHGPYKAIVWGYRGGVGLGRLLWQPQGGLRPQRPPLCPPWPAPRGRGLCAGLQRPAGV